MTPTIQFLNDQVKSEEIWKPDHERAMECVALQDKIKVGLSLFGLFAGVDDLWSRRVQSGTEEFSEEMASRLHTAFDWWIKPCEEVFAAVAIFEHEGFRVDATSDLRTAYVKAKGILKTNFPELIEGMKKARSAAVIRIAVGIGVNQHIAARIDKLLKGIRSHPDLHTKTFSLGSRVYDCMDLIDGKPYYIRVSFDVHPVTKDVNNPDDNRRAGARSTLATGIIPMLPARTPAKKTAKSRQKSKPDLRKRRVARS